MRLKAPFCKLLFAEIPPSQGSWRSRFKVGTGLKPRPTIPELLGLLLQADPRPSAAISAAVDSWLAVHHLLQVVDNQKRLHARQER